MNITFEALPVTGVCDKFTLNLLMGHEYFDDKSLTIRSIGFNGETLYYRMMKSNDFFDLEQKVRLLEKENEELREYKQLYEIYKSEVGII